MGGERRAFDRVQLLAAFDRVGEAAARQGVMLDLAVYGGSALMLASIFRASTEVIDIAELATPWPEWLVEAVGEVARVNAWSPQWLNDAVQFHLSPLADRSADHHEYGTFPRGGPPGLRISVPTLHYMLALKLKAMRVKGPSEKADIQSLIRAGQVADIDEARPSTLSAVAERIRSGVPEGIALPDFLDEFYICTEPERRAAMLRQEPAWTGRAQIDALLAAVAEYLTKQFALPGTMPGWVSGPGRVLAEPWFTTTAEGDGMREFLSYSSPAEFSSHGIFTEARPLRRATLRRGD